MTKVKMKAFIGRYFTTLENALAYYSGLSKELQEHQSICETEGRYFIVSNEQIKKFNNNETN